MSYPVTFDVAHPPVQRAHVFLRLALLIVIGWIGHPFGLALRYPESAWRFS